MTKKSLVERLRAEYSRTGAYAPTATCKHGVHPYECRQGCAPPTFEAADKIEHLTKALEFYADERNHFRKDHYSSPSQDFPAWQEASTVMTDYGRRARIALNTTEPP